MNANAGFGTEDFRRFCYKNEISGNIDENLRNGAEIECLCDEMLSKCRFVIERLDAFKAILMRFETNTIHWKAMNILAFCGILIG